MSFLISDNILELNIFLYPKDGGVHNLYTVNNATKNNPVIKLFVE